MLLLFAVQGRKAQAGEGLPGTSKQGFCGTWQCFGGGRYYAQYLNDLLLLLCG